MAGGRSQYQQHECCYRFPGWRLRQRCETGQIAMAFAGPSTSPVFGLGPTRGLAVDVAVIPMTRWPTGIGPDSPELQDAIIQLRGFAGCRIPKRLIFLGLTLKGLQYTVACERRILWRKKIARNYLHAHIPQ